MKEPLLKDFVNYLEKKGHRVSVIVRYANTISLFLRHTEKQRINCLEVSYTDMLNYINHLQEKGNRKSTINGALNIIRHFYNQLQKAGKVKINPAETLKVKNVTQKVPHNLLEQEEQEQLYKDYPCAGIVGKRNKLILGLMIYQGLRTADISSLEITDIKLEEGKINVPATCRSNSRIMQLESFQVLQLQKYITQLRPVILSMTGKQSNKLFTSIGSGSRMISSYTNILAHLKKLNPRVKDYKQIRASIITHWLKQYNIRQVQYMAGHRYISSTEVYRTDTLESLQEMINELHPLK
jgi:site-specific recombinase XerD